jgi:outer membrane protein
MLRIKIFMLICGIVLSSASRSQQKWDLKQCVEYALANNVSIKQQDVQARLAKLTLDQSKLGQYPNISAGVNNGLNFGRAINPVSNSFENTRLLFQGWSLQTSVDVFSWGVRRYTIKANLYDYQASLASVDKAKNDLALNIAGTYLQILLAQAQVKSSEVQLAQRKAQLLNTRRRVDAGTLPELNAAELESQLATDSSNLIGVKNSVEQALLNMKAVLNLDAATPFDIVTPEIDNIAVENILDLQPESVYALAVKNFPQQRVNELRQKAAMSNIEASRRAMYPSVSMSASIGSNYAYSVQKIPLFSNNPTFVPNGSVVNVGATQYNVLQPVFTKTGEVQKFYPDGYFKQNGDNLRQNIGLNINIPIFNGGSLRNNYERSKLNAKNIDLTRDQDNQRLKQDIYKAFIDATTALQKYNANKKAAELSKKTFDFATKRYDLGLLNTIDYITNQNNYFRATLDLLYS